LTKSKSPPQTLEDAIRRLANASAGFVVSWAARDLRAAHATTEEAFRDLDHIQNEILRRRDERRAQNALRGTAFEQALGQPVGELVAPVAPADKTAFLNLPPGDGALPANPPPEPLKLDAALNKLKHREHINFVIPDNGGHVLLVLTLAAMGKPDSLCRIDVRVLCAACRVAQQSL